MSAAGKVTFNWQMGVILALTMLMLAVPLTCVVLFGKSYFDARRQSAQAAPEVPGLREKMETAADARLPAEPLLEDDKRPVLRIEWPAGARAQLLKEILDPLRATLVETEPNVRFLVRGPGGTAAALAKAAGVKNPPSLPAGGSGEFFEILFVDPQ